VLEVLEAFAIPNALRHQTSVCAPVRGDKRLEGAAFDTCRGRSLRRGTSSAGLCLAAEQGMKWDHKAIMLPGSHIPAQASQG